MLNIRFRRSSAPITDAELLSIIDGIRPALADPDHPDKDYALLLARMFFRIEAMQVQSRMQLPSTSKPFAYFRWNSSWKSWEQVVDSAAGWTGVIAAYTALPQTTLAAIMGDQNVIDALMPAKESA